MKWSFAATSDIPTVLSLVNSAYRGEYAKQGWTTETDILDGTRVTTDLLTEDIERDDSWVLMFLDDSGRMIGCVHLEKKDSTVFYLGMLAVEPTLQRGGIGKEIMRICEEFVTERGARRIEMTVIDGRTELIDWYCRRGYTRTAERRPFPKDDARFGIPKRSLEFVVFTKDL